MGIVQQSSLTHRVVLVVSAVSSQTKAQGTTSLLLEACESASLGRSFEACLESIQAQHLNLITESIHHPRAQEAALAYVNERLAWVRSFLSALSVIKDLSPRSRDAVIAVGEQLSATIVTAALSEAGLRAETRDLSSIVPADFQDNDHDWLPRLASLLASKCEPAQELIPVVTGFFGPVSGGLLNRIGRGYSDFTAALLATGYGAKQTEELQIWKEVDGVFSTDPRRVPNAKVLPMLSAHEASELTYFGSEVIHPFTMEQVMSEGIPIRVKNTHRPQSDGTLIVPTLAPQGKKATALTAKRGVTVAMIKSNRMYEARGFLAGVFGVMRDLDISVDLVSTSEISISFTADDASALEQSRSRLEEFGDTTIMKNRAILSVVGEGLKGYAGAAGKLFSALGDSGINIEMISQGISETNISCVIPESDVENALQIAHRAFFE